jgi:RNA polymerase sigma-70 factor (ECF subfamily)
MDWREVTSRYGDRVFLVVRSIVRDETLALDVSQETLLKVGRALNGQAKVGKYDTWVLTVAANAARDALRRKTRRREVTMDRDLVDAREGPADALLQEESRERVTRALEALPAGARDILLLKFREGLSGPQIAQALGLSLGAAWQKLSRSMKLLRSSLSEHP